MVNKHAFPSAFLDISSTSCLHSYLVLNLTWQANHWWKVELDIFWGNYSSTALFSTCLHRILQTGCQQGQYKWAPSSFLARSTFSTGIFNICPRRVLKKNGRGVNKFSEKLRSCYEALICTLALVTMPVLVLIVKIRLYCPFMRLRRAIKNQQVV